MVACAKSNIELVQELFRRNVDVNYQDVNGATCLHAAVEYNLPIVQELIDRGADVTLMVEEMTAYQLARMQYNDEIQRIILKPIMGKDTDKLIELTRLFDHKIIKDVDERIAKLLSVLSPYFERSRLIGDILGAYYYVKAQETSGSSSKQAFQLGLKYSLPRKSSYLAYLSIYPEIEVAEQALVNFPGDANLLLIKANILLQQKSTMNL
ncbi:MAG: ankyrin repeat domain-containing protein [Coxiellaceae bacterium]|nr:MAG: ankyrin repeat domain-containing protein [Coxiellaceae bacterium]